MCRMRVPCVVLLRFFFLFSLVLVGTLLAFVLCQVSFCVYGDGREFVCVDSLISTLFWTRMACKFVIYGELRLFQFHMATAEVKVFETKEH